MSKLKGGTYVDIDSEDPDLRCPITMDMFVDPVVASDGNTYERSAISTRNRRGYPVVTGSTPNFA